LFNLSTPKNISNFKPFSSYNIPSPNKDKNKINSLFDEEENKEQEHNEFSLRTQEINYVKYLIVDSFYKNN